MKQILILLTLLLFTGCTKNYYEIPILTDTHSREVEGTIDQNLVTLPPTFVLTYLKDNKIKVSLKNPPINYGNPDEFVWVNKWYVSKSFNSGSKLFYDTYEVYVNKGAGFTVTVQTINLLTGIKSQEITTGINFK